MIQIRDPHGLRLRLTDDLMVLMPAVAFWVLMGPAICRAGEQLIRATLPVEILCSGNTAFGYKQAGKRARPARVQVTGPEGRIRQMTYVKTHSLDITGASETIEKELPLDLPEGIRLVNDDGNSQRVHARVAIEKQVVEKTFENIPVRMVHNDYPSIVRPNAVTITIRGARLFFANDFSRDDIQILMDLKGMGPGLHVLPVQIRLPDETDLLRIDPQVFTVRILLSTPKQSGDNNAAGT
jgi:YbbR domain-containing protein